MQVNVVEDHDQRIVNDSEDLTELIKDNFTRHNQFAKFEASNIVERKLSE